MPLVHRAIELALALGLVASVAYWGWQTADDVTTGWLLAGVAAVVIALVWAIARFSGGRGFLPVAFSFSGRARLIAELLVIGIAATAAWTGGSRAASETLLTVFGVHYALNWERLVRMVKNGTREPTTRT